MEHGEGRVMGAGRRHRAARVDAIQGGSGQAVAMGAARQHRAARTAPGAAAG
jgi:hypothetical protein